MCYHSTTAAKSESNHGPALFPCRNALGDAALSCLSPLAAATDLTSSVRQPPSPPPNPHHHHPRGKVGMFRRFISGLRADFRDQQTTVAAPHLNTAVISCGENIVDGQMTCGAVWLRYEEPGDSFVKVAGMNCQEKVL